MEELDVIPDIDGLLNKPAANRSTDSEARRRIDVSGRRVRLEIDGGVKVSNIAGIARAGADTFVAGSAVFGADDYAATISAMRAEIGKGRTGA